MDLLNATGEEMRQLYGGQLFVFPSQEQVKVDDACGRFMLGKLSEKGLQEVSFGDDVEEVSYNAISGIVTFHKRQIAVHDEMNKKQAELKYPLVDAPDGVVQAHRALKVYLPMLAKLEKEKVKRDGDNLADQIQANATRRTGMPKIEDMKYGEIRNNLLKLGVEHRQNESRSALAEKLRAKLGGLSEAVAKAK